MSKVTCGLGRDALLEMVAAAGSSGGKAVLKYEGEGGVRGVKLYLGTYPVEDRREGQLLDCALRSCGKSREDFLDTVDVRDGYLAVRLNHLWRMSPGCGYGTEPCVDETFPDPDGGSTAARAMYGRATFPDGGSTALLPFGRVVGIFF